MIHANQEKVKKDNLSRKQALEDGNNLEKEKQIAIRKRNQFEKRKQQEEALLLE